LDCRSFSELFERSPSDLRSADRALQREQSANDRRHIPKKGVGCQAHAPVQRQLLVRIGAVEQPQSVIYLANHAYLTVRLRKVLPREDGKAGA
jgi:hypothetical protein